MIIIEQVDIPSMCKAIPSLTEECIKRAFREPLKRPIQRKVEAFFFGKYSVEECIEAYLQREWPADGKEKNLAIYHLSKFFLWQNSSGFAIRAK